MPALDALMRRVEAARPLRLANAAFAQSAALNRFGRAWLAACERRASGALGLLDFDDLIDRAAALLERPGTAAWVLWRLDGGLDHILVDEAQDTSPAQWRVIEALVGGVLRRRRRAATVARTIFVVGDEKQSIYSFQGADPAEFGAKCAHYDRVLDRASAPSCSAATCSTRSARRAPILALVDAVFAGPAGRGARAGDRPPRRSTPRSPGGSSSGRSCRSPSSPTRAPGTSRSTPARPTTRSRCSPRRIAGDDRRLAGEPAARCPASRRRGRSAPAT